MRTFSLLTSLFAASVVSSASAQAATPNQIPIFETLLFGTLDGGETDSLNGPFGTRLNIAVIGGNLTDPTGKPVATVLPAADTGIISNSGIFFPEAVIPLKWVVDDKLAYLHLSGVGVPFVSDVAYVHLETDSETYSAWNSRFLVANVTFPAGENSDPIFTLFGLV